MGGAGQGEDRRWRSGGGVLSRGAASSKTSSRRRTAPELLESQRGCRAVAGEGPGRLPGDVGARPFRPLDFILRSVGGP